MSKLVKGTDKILFGVCSGIGNFLGIDATIVRVVFALLTLCYGGGLLVYLILALCMPKE